MNKAELVDLVAESIGEPKTVVRKAIASITDAIRSELGSGKDVALFDFGTFKVIERITRTGRNPRTFDFGTFKVIERQARTGRNPKTGEPIEIQARKAVKFKAGKLLK